MPDDDPLTDTDPQLSTREVIEQARRPLVIARHREVVSAAELYVTPGYLEKVAQSDRTIVGDLLDQLAHDEFFHRLPLREALIQAQCLELEQGACTREEVAGRGALVYLVIGDRLAERHGAPVSIGDLRTLPARHLARLLSNDPGPGFGCIGFTQAAIHTASQGERVLQRVRVLARGEGGDTTWHEAAGDPPLSRELEEPLQALPEEARWEARRRLVADRVRHHFFINVFLKYFDADTLDPREIEAHGTILAWLDSIEETPHLFPFMQGQTDQQKAWRLSQLWRKIVQMNELYQRVDQASRHPSYREAFAELDTRARLAVLAKERYPALKVDDAFAIATALCPFSGFAAWVQEKVGAKDFVLPPEPR